MKQIVIQHKNTGPRGAKYYETAGTDRSFVQQQIKNVIKAAEDLAPLRHDPDVDAAYRELTTPDRRKYGSRSQAYGGGANSAVDVCQGLVKNFEDGQWLWTDKQLPKMQQVFKSASQHLNSVEEVEFVEGVIRRTPPRSSGGQLPPALFG
jgi:hypothetical protein